MTTLTATLIEDLRHCRRAEDVQQEEFIAWMLREQARIEAITTSERTSHEEL